MIRQFEVLKFIAIFLFTPILILILIFIFILDIFF